MCHSRVLVVWSKPAGATRHFDGNAHSVTVIRHFDATSNCGAERLSHSDASNPSITDTDCDDTRPNAAARIPKGRAEGGAGDRRAHAF